MTTLQRALLTLADARRRLEPAAAAAGPARHFADYLAQHAPSTVLRYSQRLELIRAARRFGIDRFEANLLIASVVDRTRRHIDAEPPVRRDIMGAITAFLVVQGAVVVGAWWTFFR